MLFHLKSFGKPSPPASSTSSAYASTLPHSSSYFASDQYPFPTDPAQVKKARHYNHPKYLPRPSASARDVQYFLYTLLTSKRHNCAKKYPEWVLETCMGWGGDGETFRSCSEEQLATLCPYTAVAIGIESRKHRPGAFVPIPARNMIGEVIVRFVTEKKAKQNLPGEIQHRLQAERSRSFSGSRLAPLPQVANDRGTFGNTMPTSPQLSRHSSLRSSSLTERTNLSVPTPAMWMTPAPTTAMRNFTPETLPSGVPMYGEFIQYAPHQLIYNPPNVSGMPGPPLRDAQFSTNTHELSQRRTNSYASKDLRASSGSFTTTRSGVTSRSLSQRYAPRRQSDLRASSMTSKEAPDRSSASNSTPQQNSTPQHKKPAVNTAHKVAEPVPPARPHAMRRRRSSLASSSKFSIPERITEELEHSDVFDTYSKVQQAWRHDSGVDDLPRVEHSRSASLPGFAGLESSHPSSLRVRDAPMLKMPRFEYNNTIDESHDTADPSQGSGNALPVAREMARLSSFNFGRSDSICSTSATSALSPTLHSPKTPEKPNTSIMNRRRADYAVVEPKTGRLESEYDHLQQVQGVQHPSIPMRTVSLRSSRSDRTVYSSFNSVPKRDTGNKHTVHTAPSSPSRTQSLKAGTQPLTMIDLIEQKERRARKLSSACQQWISRQKNMTRLGVDLKRS